MKKITTLSLALACVLGLTACNQDKAAQSPDKQTQAQSGTTQNDPKTGEITLHTATGEVKLPANPAPIAVYDMTALQNLAACRGRFGSCRFGLGFVCQGFGRFCLDCTPSNPKRTPTLGLVW